MNPFQKKLILIFLVWLPFTLFAQIPAAATDLAKKPQAEKPIRVGLIGCDSHGMWFSP